MAYRKECAVTAHMYLDATQVTEGPLIRLYGEG